MGCAIGVVKYLLFIFNLIFALSGLALLVMGVLIWKDINSYNEVSDFLDTKITGPPLVMIGVGAVIFIVAFFGCCGAVRESHCMMIMFAILLLVIFIAEIALGVVAFLHRNEIENNTENAMYKSFNKYVTSADARKTFDALQNDLDCCGVDNPSDYKDVFRNDSLPSSCCVVNKGEMCKQFQGAAVVHQKGCYQALKEFVSSTGMILGSVAIGVAFIEIIGIIFALCLASSIKNEDRRMGRP